MDDELSFDLMREMLSADINARKAIVTNLSEAEIHALVCILENEYLRDEFIGSLS